MKAIRKRPGEPAELIELENTLKALQAEVGGYIETVTLAKDCVVICDEEGRINGKPHNCHLCGKDFVGTILILGVDGDEFCDVLEVALLVFPQNEKAPAGRQPDVSADENNQVQISTRRMLCQSR